MNKAFLLLLCLLLASCDAQEENSDRSPNVLRASVNGQAIEFITSIAAITDAEAASIGGTYCVADRFPRNLHISFLIPEPFPATYLITPNQSEVRFHVSDVAGDAIAGTYHPVPESGSSVTIESDDQDRLQGRFSGTFVIEHGALEYRYFPDTLRIENGMFDLSLVPLSDFEAIWEYPCQGAF